MLFGFGKQKKKTASASPAETAYWKAKQAERTDKRRALRLYEKAAQLGYAKAAYSCGLMYRKGEGTENNPEKALACFLQAAEQGNVYAMFSCGRMYEYGEGTQADPRKALEWYERSANRGDGDAQQACGRLYRADGPLHDLKKALYWYEQAAEKNYRDSQQACGELYRMDGPLHDPKKALYWFTQLANGPMKPPMPCFECARLCAGEGGLAPNREKALEWLRRCQEHREYKESASFRSNVDELVARLAKEEQGIVDALLEKGQAAWEAKRYPLAVETFTQAVELGSTEAMVRLWHLYEEEDTGVQDLEQSVRWMEKAGELGDMDAMKACLDREAHRENGKWDFQRLRYWAEKLAELGDGEGCYMAGLIYCDGFGLEKDLNKAHKYLEQAANKNVKGAKQKYLEVHFRLLRLEGSLNIF